MSENPASTVSAETNPSKHQDEPPRSPLKLVVIIGVVLILLLVFGALDS